MEIGITKQVQVEAKTLKLHLKVCDRFSAVVVDQDGSDIYQHEGYVPGFMPEEHYGDYVILDIDIDSGQIMNWNKPTVEELQSFIAGEND